jgi:hypothetical protein
MAVRTVHIYRSNGAWTVKKEGQSAEAFSTQKQAVAAARKSIKKERAGQFVVHGPNGEIRKHESHGMTRIQEHPKKSPIARQIARAVGKVVLERVQSDSHPSSEHSA